jgi:peptidoglycan/LPS O-acetylase OafA/YrhL
MAAGASRISARQVPALDGVRGIAILIVLLHHFESILPGSNLALNLIKATFYMGWSGVDLFFVLSGFLITGILVDTKQAKNYFSSFYARRILRIFPLYYGVLTLIVFMARAFYRPAFDNILPLRSDQIYYFFYLNNWWVLLKDKWHANIIGHFWSLAVEEQFYLLWPMCVWLIPRRHLLRVALFGCGLALVLRIALVKAYGPSHAIDQNTFTRMDALLAGACCAMVVRSESLIAKVKAWLTPAMWIAAAGVLAIVFLAGEMWQAGVYMETVGFSLLSVGYSALVLRAYLEQGRPSRAQKIFTSAPLRAMGKYSYGIYVWHVPILWMAMPFVPDSFGVGRNPLTSALWFVALIGISFVMAATSYDLFESPFLRLKSRFSPQFDSALPAMIGPVGESAYEG